MMKKKIDKKNFLFIIISLVVVIVLIIISYIGYQINYHNEQVSLLREEIVLIQELDLFESTYEIDTKTSGDYAYIEESIKAYYKDLSTNIKTIYAYLNDENLIQILSAKNLKYDGPNFGDSFKILTNTRENINMTMNNIIDLCNEEKIKNYLDKGKVSNYYYNLYIELMYEEEDLEMLNNTQKEMQEIKDNLSIFLDKVEGMLNMLKTNKNFWYIKDEQLYFETNKLVDDYNNLYNELNTFVIEKFSKYKNNNNEL